MMQLNTLSVALFNQIVQVGLTHVAYAANFLHCYKYDEEEHFVEAVEEDGEVVINFEGSWYRTVDDFFAKASIDGIRLVIIGWELYDFEVIK